MDTQELVRRILKRLDRFKILVLLGAVLMAVLMFFYARSIPVKYTVRSTLFPLGTGETSSGSKLSELISGTSKSPGAENVSIEEVGKSKKTRVAVVAQRLPQYGNKMIAEILINEYNKTRSFLSPAIEIPKADSSVIETGASLAASRYSVKFNKTGILEINVWGIDQKLLEPFNYQVIDKVTQFYTELKTEKAKTDYDFVQRKIDSLERVVIAYDRRRVQLDKTTLFVPEDRLQYSVPKDILDNDRARVMSQRNGAAANREEALWSLQKVTPIIKLLDKPALSGVEKPSAVTYAAMGFFVGIFLFALIFISGILYRYAKLHIHAMLGAKNNEAANTTTTA